MSLPKVKIPDRYESLVRMPNGGELQSVVVPVSAGLDALDAASDDMSSAGRGAFMILLGASGSGKSTLLHTAHLFRPGVITIGVESDESLQAALDDLDPYSGSFRIVVIKGREALADTTDAELQAELLAINSFIRRKDGENTLVVWPCNMRELGEKLQSLAGTIGGGALLGVHRGVFEYKGPSKGQYLTIATRTIEALNAGASLVSLGIAERRAQDLADQAPTIGGFMQSLREEARRNQSALQSRAQDSFQLWTVVIAGNDPESEVSSLTRGANYSADIDKLLVSTEANVAQDLKRYPEKLGLLGASVGARILHVPFMTAMAVIRDFADDDLRQRLTAEGFPMTKDGKGEPRLRDGQLGGALQERQRGLHAPGRPPNEDRKQEFMKLMAIARTDDGALNKTFGRALQSSGLIKAFRPEASVGDTSSRNSDLLCDTESGAVRLEFMWRAKTTSGEIAKYVLEKLRNYGKVIKFLNGA